MTNRILTLLLLGWALGGPATAVGATPPGMPAFALQVERADDAAAGKVYRIASSATVAAAPDAVWRVLTDYDHLADFVPDLKSARVLSRDGDKVVVEQLGMAHFLFFSHAIRLVVQVHEQVPDRIDISLVDGNMKVYRCSWELTSIAGTGGTRVRYTATIAPDFYVPEFVGERLIRNDIGRMMTAVLARAGRGGE